MKLILKKSKVLSFSVCKIQQGLLRGIRESELLNKRNVWMMRIAMIF